MSEQFGDFIARLTDNARTSLRYAESIASAQGSTHIGTEHLLLGVMAQGTSVGAKMLADAGITVERAGHALNIVTKSLSPSGNITSLSDTAMLTLRMAYDQARELNQQFLGTEHILYSILRQKTARGTIILRDMQVDVEQLIDELEAYFDRQGQDYTQDTSMNDIAARTRNTAGPLDMYGTDITKAADDKELDTVIGRDKEVQRLITTLSRRTKNNPLLIGEPGVGKTAIVEGLAQRISTGAVPAHMLESTIIQLDLAAMVAGTKYRGEFEDRLKKVLDELADRDDAIVFIDEIHLLVGAGSAEGSMDAANIIKPALARGKMRLIGATTLDEYRKYIEKDSALDRRFQSVLVDEPSTSDTISIVKGLRSHYEDHHNVILSDTVLELAVRMADRYVSDRRQPDKSIDVIDEAAAEARVTAKAPPRALGQTRAQIDQLNEKIEDAVSSQDYERAALYKTHMHKLQQKQSKLEAEHASSGKITLTDDHVAKAVAAMTGVPVDKIHSSERKMLQNLERRLSRYIVGQDEAVSTVARAIRRSRSGVSTASRPIGSFVFMGPSGVGKTELARVLAQEVFGSRDALIKIDMSEFGEKHTTSGLIGSPAGYVGYEDGGKLTDKVRRRPYSVVLFDEIEKAHPDVFQLLLQILEDGTLTDSGGRVVSFSNTVIILTSNLGSEIISRDTSLGFAGLSITKKSNITTAHEEHSVEAKRALEGFMLPEIINRFDAIVTFKMLGRSHLRRIARLLLDELSDRLRVQGIGLSVSPAALRLLLDQSISQHKGARPLRRSIEDSIEHLVAEKIINNETAAGDILQVSVRNGKFEITVKNESTTTV